jgi:2'-5' RNA ligase
MRIFIALDITEEIRRRIERFIEGLQNFAPDVHWVRPESLHVTLKFIGEKSDETVKSIKQALNSISATSFALTFRGYGFFPSVRSARVFWTGIESGPEFAALAALVDESTASLNIPREDHPFTPHLTLARGKSAAPQGRRGDAPNERFAKLQEKLSAFGVPDFGTMTAHEFFLYQSRLSRDGAYYTKLAKFALKSQS